MRLTELELNLLFSLVDFASKMDYKNLYSNVENAQSNIYIPRNILNSYKSVDDFKIACNLLKLKLARG